MRFSPTLLFHVRDHALPFVAKNLLTCFNNKTSLVLQQSARAFSSLRCLDSDFNFCRNRKSLVNYYHRPVNPPPYLKRPSSVGPSNSVLTEDKQPRKMAADDNLIWIDCEMSGLDLATETLMEVACIITGPNVDIIARLPSIIIKTDERILNAMDTWCVQHHGQSGLTKGCLESKITVQDAEEMLLKFVKLHTNAGACPLAGNSIFLDRAFLAKYMPKFHAHFHYRNVDVSTIKEIVRRWYPTDYTQVCQQKRYEHRCMADIEDSINELKYYRDNIFKPPQQSEMQVEKEQL